jgi:hypothetical protein
MESAFGIDHGYEDIEKFGFGALGAKIGGGLAAGGSKLARSGAQAMGAGRKMQAGKLGVGSFGAGSSQAMQHGKGMMIGGRLKAKTGLGMNKLGQGMLKRPGLTGGLAAGGAAAGIGGGAAAIGNRQRRF